MPNIVVALKMEIARVARKEIRSETANLKKAVASYRHEIAALKKRLQSVERIAKTAKRTRTPNHAQSGGSDDSGRQLRFSATRFASHRKKLGLSAADMAKLLGVSALSVYKWEGGQTRPRRAQLESIASIRGIGKRQARAMLEASAKAA